LDKPLVIIKFGGSLLDPEGSLIPTIVERIKELKRQSDTGPLVVVSALSGFTDKLNEIGRSYAEQKETNIHPLFRTYFKLAKRYVSGEWMTELIDEIEAYANEVQDTLDRIVKRFEGPSKARVLTSGGELPISALLDAILKSNGIDSIHLRKSAWPIVTDDNYENANPRFDDSLAKIPILLDPLTEGKVVVQAGFLGMTRDGLETTLGRGGSDQTAVFDACLLKGRYAVQTILVKESPVFNADPAIVDQSKLSRIECLTYNEAAKATVAGMKIVQGAAVRLAHQYRIPITIAPLNKLNYSTVIQETDKTDMTVKCITCRKDCAIISMNDSAARSLEASLRLWEGFEEFIDLGTEILETGEIVRDFLVFDGEFIRKHEERIRGFDKDLEISYGVGVVTLIGDRMRNSPGIASLAIGAIPDINIIRAVFAPHTSQIIIVISEGDVENAVRRILEKYDEMNSRSKSASRTNLQDQNMNSV
jgi:aspartate kinase